MEKEETVSKGKQPMGKTPGRKTTDGKNTTWKKHHLEKNTTWGKQQGLTMHTLAEYQSLLSLTSVNGKMLLINMMLLHHNFLHGFTAFS